MSMRRIPGLLLAFAIGIALPAAQRGTPSAGRHNIVLFVADGLRPAVVNDSSAPALSALRARGVTFTDTHSLAPTVTMANASAMATGHALGDTGLFSNSMFSGFPVPAAGGSVVPNQESDATLGDMDQHFDGDQLNDGTFLAVARAAGYHTAAIGKLGPTLIFDHTDRTGDPTIVIDDATGTSAGIPLSTATAAMLTSAGLPLATPGRGDNGKGGSSTTPGTTVANVAQQNYFVDVATKAVLPAWKQAGGPFVLVFWSRDPDGTQHFEGDSLNALTPGINGPTSMAAVRNADDDLGRLETALDALGLAATTDVFAASDHGFSTISKESQTSRAAKASYPGVPKDFLPPGFLAIDLAAALNLPLFDPDNKNAPVASGALTKRGNAVLGADPAHPDVVIAANGGSDLVYVPSHDHALLDRIVTAVAAEDYTSALFADDAFGDVAGALPLSAIGLKGSARTPTPSLVVGFRTFSTGCRDPLGCGVQVSDTTYQQGQGNHGSFSRADTMSFLAAAGPDLKAKYTDALPVSNADLGRTIAELLGSHAAGPGTLAGRVLSEALVGGARPPAASPHRLTAKTAVAGVQTVLAFTRVGNTLYVDVAGTPGRTLGLAR